MTAIDYETEYDNRTRVPEHPQIFARWAKDSESYRTRMAPPHQARLSYGATPREIIDLFDARPDAPLAVFSPCSPRSPIRTAPWWRALSR